MYINYVFNPIDQPTFHPQKEFWSSAGSAVISGAASLLGGLFGSKSNSKTNSTNAQIARETNASNERIAQQNNEYNYRMFQEQQQYNIDQWKRESNWNLDMWNKQNAYNEQMYNKYQSPASMVQQYRDAGINPNLVAGSLGSGSLGSASGSVNTSSAGGVTAPTASPYQAQASYNTPYDISSTFAQIGDIIANTRLKNAQAKDLEASAQGKEISNSYSADMWKAQLDNLLASTNKTRTDRNFVKWQIDRGKKFMSIDYANAQLDAMGKEMQGVLAQDMHNQYVVENQILKTQLRYLPEMLQKDIAFKSASTFSAYQSGRLSEQQVKTELQKTILTEAQANGQKFSNEQTRKMSDELFKQVKAQTIILETQSKHDTFNLYNPFEYIPIQALSRFK